ncbi:MAG TPA: hypothetical protein VGB46_07260 [Flavisolibacter sp.]|jgi:hypothetical protein
MKAPVSTEAFLFNREERKGAQRGAKAFHALVPQQAGKAQRKGKGMAA